MSNSTTDNRGVGIAIVASAFQADETGLTPVPRSKRIRAYCECGNAIPGYKNKICMSCHRNKFKKKLVERSTKLTIKEIGRAHV